MYLNVYVPWLKTERGVVQFFRGHRGQLLSSTALMNPMSRSLLRSWKASWRSTRYLSCSSAKGSAKTR
jgi:hypothetical protein